MTDDLFYFANHSPELRDGILRIRRNRYAVFSIGHKLVSSPRERPIEPNLTQPSNEVPTLTGYPPTHGSAPR